MVESEYKEKLEDCKLKKIVCLSNSSDLYFNHKPKRNLKDILSTVGSELSPEFPISLMKFLGEKKHIHFEYMLPREIISTQDRLRQGSIEIRTDFSHFPEKKEENTINNQIFNKLIDTFQKPGGGWSTHSCSWKNDNNRSARTKPLAIDSLD